MNFAENIQCDILPDICIFDERQRSDRLVLSLEGGHVAAHDEAKLAGLLRFSTFALLHAVHIYAVIDDLDLICVQSDLLPVLTDSLGNRDIAVN